MRKKMYILILLLVIGFASLTATLTLKGTTTVSFNEGDYNIFFSEAIVDGVDKSNIVIVNEGQTINYDTSVLTLINDTSVLEYEVTNNSKQYDAQVKINCTINDARADEYVDLENTIDKEIIPARSKANGSITVRMKKTIVNEQEFKNGLTCTLEAEAISKETIVEEEVQQKVYYTYGFLVDNNNEPIVNSVVAILDNDEIKYATTDKRGMYIVTGLSSGEHDLNVISNMTLEEVKTKTAEELATLATYKTKFSTTGTNVTLENNYLKYGTIVAGEPTINTLTLDSNGGTTENFTSKIIEGQKVGFLPTFNHETLVFESWQTDGNIVTENTVFNGDKTIYASYGTAVARIADKKFSTLNLAFDYVTTSDETTIDVIADNSLTGPITNDKNIILNLNEKNVNFEGYNLKNNNKLEIKNGSIQASGINVLINAGELNLNNNLNIEHVNHDSSTDVKSTIINNEGKTLNVDNVNVTSDALENIGLANMLSNFGTSTISNSNLTSVNTQIVVFEGSTLNFNDTNFNTKNSKANSGCPIITAGETTVNGGTYQVSADNQGIDGIFGVDSKGVLNINSGTIDNTYGKHNAIYVGGTLNLGENNKNIRVISNNTTYYALANEGTLNIPGGNITVENGAFVGNNGTLTVGTETTTPIITGLKGSIFAIDSNRENKIVNANITAQDGKAIGIYENAKLTIDNINLTQSSKTNAQRAINLEGELTIKDGTFRINEDNTNSSGLFYVYTTGTLNIESGSFDNTYGKTNAIAVDGILNLGKNNKNITFIGNNTTNYTIGISGTINILDGNIEADNGPFIMNQGLLTIGTATTTPTVTGPIENSMFDIYSNQNNKIVNGNLNSRNGDVLYLHSNSKLTIDNVNLVQSNTTDIERAIYDAGELIINGGSFKTGEDNQSSYGLLTVVDTGTVTINAGTFDNTYGKGNSFYIANGILNIGANNKDVTFYGNSTAVSTIYNAGTISIPTGNINYGKGNFIADVKLLTVGTETTTPTITGSGYSTFDIMSDQENKIVNANINVNNSAVINVTQNKKLTIDNINLTQSNSTNNSRAIATDGELIINNGTFQIGQDNQTGYGLLTALGSATLTIKSGSFDNTYGKANSIYTAAGSTLNLGENNKNINFVGNGLGHYIICALGTFNIPEGNITIENGPYSTSAGLLTVGTETTKPTIIAEPTNGLFTIDSSQENKIINADINTDNALAFYLNNNAKLTIDNGTYHSSMMLLPNSVLNIDGGTYEYNGWGNMIYIQEQATVNIGANEKNSISLHTYSDYLPLIANHGSLNIHSGRIIAPDNNVILQMISDENNETAEEKLNYAAITRIYGGYIENTSDRCATISINAGRLEMTNGEVVNKGTNNTIINLGGTSIQSGGTSLKNSGVTVE